MNKVEIIIMGNEANGISKEVAAFLMSSIAISRFGVQQATESLNLDTAAAICSSEFKRK